MTHSGACLCGQTKITISGEPIKAQVVCHCTDCRQTTGSAFSTCVLVPQKNITISGPIKEYSSKVDSGNSAVRVFCGNCGAGVSHKSPVFKDGQVLSTGLFPDFATIPVTAELYVKDRWGCLTAIDGAAQVQAMPTGA